MKNLLFCDVNMEISYSKAFRYSVLLFSAPLSGHPLNSDTRNQMIYSVKLKPFNIFQLLKNVLITN